MNETERRWALLERLYHEVDGVPGDVVELGVKYGTTLALFCEFVATSNHDREVWGFDAWPKDHREFPYSPHDGGRELHAYRPWEGSGTQGAIREKIRRSGIDEARVHLVRGYFAETLPGFSRRVALIHFDGDLYESYRTGYESLWHLLQPGGICILDEYHSPEWPGAKTATDEFLATLPTDSYSLHEGFRWWITKLG